MAGFVIVPIRLVIKEWLALPSLERPCLQQKKGVFL